jgi:hypothetical protein
MGGDGTGPPGLELPALARLRSAFKDKRWDAIASMIDAPWIWAFDRPLPVPEAVRALGALFDAALDLELLVTAALQRARRGDEARDSFRCCVMWGEPGGWREHELEFDLHLGAPSGGGARLSYLGLTAPGS